MFTMSAWAEADVTRVKEYFVDVLVHENKTYDVTEYVTVHFAEPHHGFFRYVPYKYFMSNKTYYCEIKDWSVEGDECEFSDEEQNILFKIGSEDRYVEGDKDYILKYTIQDRDDRIKSHDMFFHSIIGEYFELPIDYLGFSVVFEKGLPESAEKKLRVFSGGAGLTTNRLKVDAWVDRDTIFGEVSNVAPKNAVTLRLPLPEGYFKGTDGVTPTWAYIFLAITVLIIGVMLYYELTVKHPAITKTIEFYPPDGMCSAEVGTVIDESVDPVDLASLIPWFASKGYLKIVEKEEKRTFLSDKKYLELQKVTDDIAKEGAPGYQITFFNALFAASEDGKTMRLDKLARLEHQIEATKKQLNKKFSGDKELTEWHSSLFLVFLLFITSSLYFVADLPCRMFEGDDYLLVLLYWCIPYGVQICTVLTRASGDMFRATGWKVFACVARFAMMAAGFGIFLWVNEGDVQVSDVASGVVYFGSYIVTEFIGRLIINTKYRADMIGKLLGLKEFIKTAEKPRLEELLKEDPEYFYKIIPYAMVFDLANEWTRRFSNIAMEQPSWYESSTPGVAFSTASFMSSLSSATSDAVSCMSPSSSSGGGAGGGTGGGGGGAW